MGRVKPGCRPHTRQLLGCIATVAYWKHWPCLFPQHGPGRKHERELGMTEWQWRLVAEHPAAFLRGLFHSDRCRVNGWATRMVAGRKRRYEYGRWQFTNHSTEIQRWCCAALDLVEAPWPAVQLAHDLGLHEGRGGAAGRADRAQVLDLYLSAPSGRPAPPR
jgi:hypothetical protein